MAMRYTHQQLAAWLASHGTIKGGADPSFDQLSASTLQDLQRDVLQDNFFVDGAKQRTIRYYATVNPYTGGLFMQEPFMYNRVNGGAYFPGADVVVEEVQVLAAMQFPPRFIKEDLAFNLAQIGVINSGPAAAISIYDMYYQNAVQAASTDFNIDSYQHGQASGTNISTSRTQFVDGDDECMNDGIVQGYLGNIYTTYGNHLRNGAVGNTLNSTPLWAGDANGNTGQFNWGAAMNQYQNAVQEPDTFLSNKALWTYAWNREETKQRFGIEVQKDSRIGLEGFKMLNAYWHIDKLCPSTKFGTILPSGLSQTSSIKPSTFTGVSLTAAQAGVSGFPTSFTGTVNPGEPLFCYRMKDWKLRPTTDPEYNHNFTPLIRSQQNADLVVCFYKVATNWYSPGPRDNIQQYGFGF